MEKMIRKHVLPNQRHHSQWGLPVYEYNEITFKKLSMPFSFTLL